MVENTSRSMFLPTRVGSCLVLVLCLSISCVQSSSGITNANEQEEIEEDSLFLKNSSVEQLMSQTFQPSDMRNSTDQGFLTVDQNTTDLQGFRSQDLNSTEHQGFLHSFVESISVILVSEIGDKTFFIAAILAMQNNKLTVFLAAISALAVMTVLSALLGFVVTQFIPRVYTYYTCTAIMFLFGLKMLWEAWKMSDNEIEETQREVEREIAKRDSMVNLPGAGDSEEDRDAEASRPLPCENQLPPSDTTSTVDHDECNGEIHTVVQHNSEEDVKKGSREHRRARSLHATIRENSWFGKKCLKIFKMFTNTFAMTFLAEWGDRSQLATIVLAGINDITGVCVGGVLGHCICTGLAVICGALIAKKISARKVTILGALVFIGFAVASLFIDPYEENHLVPDVEGDDHNATVYKQNHITFIETTTLFASNTTY